MSAPGYGYDSDPEWDRIMYDEAKGHAEADEWDKAHPRGDGDTCVCPDCGGEGSMYDNGPRCDTCGGSGEIEIPAEDAA